MLTMHILLRELLQKQIAKNGNDIKKPFPFNTLDNDHESEHEMVKSAQRFDKSLHRLAHTIFERIGCQPVAN